MGIPMVSRTMVHRLANRVPHRMALCITTSVHGLHRRNEGSVRGHTETHPVAHDFHGEHDGNEAMLQLSNRSKQQSNHT